MGSLTPNASDKYDRQNEQQTRRALENAISDLQAQMYSLQTTAGTLRLADGDITLANGSNNNIEPGYSTYARVIGPSASFTITGFAGGELGRFLILRNTTAYQMTIANESASSTAANRILTNSGADVVLPVASGACAIFEYDATPARWILLAVRPAEATPAFSTIELGLTTDTTIARGSAGQPTAEGNNILVAGVTSPFTTIVNGSSIGSVASVTVALSAFYSAFILRIDAYSCDTATKHLNIQTSTDGGSSWDTTASNYVGYTVQSTTVAAISDASLVQVADVAAANTHTLSLVLIGAGTTSPMFAYGRVSNGTNNYSIQCTKIGSTAINALKLFWNGGGNFDAGTYSLIGVR